MKFKKILSTLVVVSVAMLLFVPQSAFSAACSFPGSCGRATEPGQSCTLTHLGYSRPANCKYATYGGELDEYGGGCSVCCNTCNSGYVLDGCACVLPPSCTCSCSNNPNGCNRSGSCTCSGTTPNYATCTNSCGSCQKCSNNSCVNKSCTGSYCTTINTSSCTCGPGTCPSGGSDSTGTYTYTKSGSCDAPS